MIGKVISNKKIKKKTEDSIEQKQLVNDFIWKIEKVALKKIQKQYKWFYEYC